jgi:hypothetical protein
MLETPFLKRMCQIAGVVLAITSLWLTAMFGLSISWGMMLALAVISFMASYLPAILVELSESGKHRWLVFAGMAVAVFVTAIDVTTNASTTGVHKSSDVTQATVQQAKYEDRRDAVATAKDEVALFKRLIDDLKAQNPWATSVSADGLKGQLPAIEEAVLQESKRGGCGPKCLALKEKLADVQKQIGVAEKLDDHTKKLEAANRGLGKAVAEASVSKQGESAVETQNLRLASLFTLSREPSEAAQHWTDQWLMVAIGAVITFASQFFNILGWVGDRSAKSFKDRFGINSALVPTVPVGSSVPAIRDRIVEKPVFPLREMILSHA